MPLNQDHRLLAITTALGPNALALRSFTLQEQLGRPFQIDAELSAEDGGIDLDQVVGNPATIRLNVGQGDKRYFNGYVSRLVQVTNVGGFAHYRATLVPWLWLLTRTSDCRVWVAADEPAQGKTAPEIIEEVFKLHGFADYKLSLSATYPKREFCVQYRETDFNFVSRLMEQEGIYYFFEHTDGKHTLVLADSIAAHNPFPNYAEVTFQELEKGSDREVITDWTMEKEVQSVASALNDFDFKKPKSSLLSSNQVTRNYGKAEYEIYDYPGEYLEHADGDRLADVRLNELQSRYELLHGQATARGLAVGSIFTLKSHPRSDQDRDYLVTSATVHADAGEFSSAETAAPQWFFSCKFACLDKSQQFRPARLTPEPVIQGIQTAIVVGPAGQEIYVDTHARVKVHFHWDRHDQSDENSSCWIRVSQPWAGKGFGSMNIPRIGQEVVVEFLEGDPDRPLITGRVYNAGNMPYASNAGRDGKPGNTPPSDIPQAAMMTSFKSNSTPGGGGCNEITMNDTKGAEGLFLKAQKDEIHQVGNDREDSVGHDEKRTVGHDRTKNVGHDETTTIGNNRTETVSQAESITIGGSRTESVAKDESVAVGGARTVSIGKDDALSVGQKLTIVARDEITIVTGDSSIHMKKDGTIEISGKKITISGTDEVSAGVGNQNVKCDKQQVATTGAAISSSAVGKHEITGALVKIN